MSLATKPLHLAMLVLCGCNCESSGHSEEDAERDTHWAELSFCLSGTETPAPERIARITLAAELEDVEGLEVPALPQSGAMGVPLDERGPDRRRWPTRCGPYAHALEESLEGAPAERAAQEVTSALRRGEVDSALYLLAEYARTWHAVTAVGVTPPPAPAAPLAR
ncbi:MAG: hypothetical protein AB8H86_28520, partial [Polyangiales bacterium]